MDDDRLQPVINRIDDLERRLKAVEGQDRVQGRSWVAKISLVGIVVGCLGGILGGASTFLGLWNQIGVRPDIALVLGPLDVLWDSNGRRLSFKCGVVLNNKGRAAGVVTVSRAYVNKTSGQEPFDLDLPSPDLSEKGINIRFPVSVNASAVRDIEMTLSSALPPEKEQAFRKTGLYRLILEGPQSERLATYCFWQGQSTAQQLATNGFLRHSGSDPRCASNDH